MKDIIIGLKNRLKVVNLNTKHFNLNEAFT
ncbi:hypothetical protein HNP70_000911 [Borreliella kurtenbachii]